MHIAVYSRKSKFTGKGESTENQVKLCIDYAYKNGLIQGSNEVLVYEDEGFSGKDTNRPMYIKMMEDAKLKRFDTIICYRLDRISRNIADFSKLILELQTLEINFISLREQFDTSTPMGRAMMYIASVFAQLERETIAERIKDNMLELAKSGRWLGGIAPTGFKSERLTFLKNERELTIHNLVQVDSELITVKSIFIKFLQTKNIPEVLEFCNHNDILSKNNKIFSRTTLISILRNPVYCCADIDAYNYFSLNGCCINNSIEEFDGNHGMMIYNKMQEQKGRTNKLKPMADWIVAIGLHSGTIKGEDWVLAQHILNTCLKKYSK